MSEIAVEPRPEIAISEQIRRHYPQLYRELKVKCAQMKKPIYLALFEAVSQWIDRANKGQS